MRDLGSKERILRLRLKWRTLCWMLLWLLGHLGHLGLLLRESLLQDLKASSVLALVADDLQSSRLVQETVTA